jgi:hypothetical protein
MIDSVLHLPEKESAHPRAVNPAADGGLKVIALKCTEKDPARRYASAAAVADHLDPWVRGEPIEARPVTNDASRAKISILITRACSFPRVRLI